MSNEYELSLRIRDLERKVDYLMAELGLQDKYAQAAPKSAGEDDVAALVRTGKKIEAIALYRRKHDVGLAEAKTAVEAME